MLWLNVTALDSVSVIDTLWPAASAPEAGEAVSPAGTVMVKSATGPPVALMMRAPVAGPPAELPVSVTAEEDKDSVP